MKIILTLVAVFHFGFHVGFASAQNLPTVEKVISAWDDWAKNDELIGGAVVETTSHSIYRPGPSGDPEVTTESFYIDGLNMLVCGKDLRFLKNRDYTATIHQRDSANWSLSEVMPRDKARSNRPILDEVIGDRDRIRKLNESGRVSLSLDDSQRWVLTVKEDNPSLESTQFVVDQERNWLPVEITEFALASAKAPGPLDIGAIKKRITYETKDGLHRLTSIKTVAVLRGDSSEVDFKSKSITYSDTKKPKWEECYLSHYSLPEPPFSRNRNRSRWYLGIGIVSIVLSLLLWRKVSKSS